MSYLDNTGEGVILAVGGRGIGGDGGQRGSFSGVGVMQGVKLTCFNGVCLRGDTSFDMSKVMDVQPARLQGEDVTFSMQWDIPPETMQAFMDAVQDPETDNSGPQAFYLESE